MNTLFHEKRRDERKQPSLSPAVSMTSVVIFSKVALLRSEEQTKLQSWSFVDQVQYDWLLLLVCIGTTNVSPNYGRTLFHLLRQFVKDIARHTILLPGDHSQCVRCHCNCSFYFHSTQHTSTAQPPAQHSHQRKQVVDKLNISLSFTTFCPELIWIFLKKLLTQLFVNVTMV